MFKGFVLNISKTHTLSKQSVNKIICSSKEINLKLSVIATAYSFLFIHENTFIFSPPPQPPPPLNPIPWIYYDAESFPSTDAQNSSFTNCLLLLTNCVPCHLMAAGQLSPFHVQRLKQTPFTMSYHFFPLTQSFLFTDQLSSTSVRRRFA